MFRGVMSDPTVASEDVNGKPDRLRLPSGHAYHELMKIRLCARSSPLSLAQVREITPALLRVFPGAELAVVPLTTPGDRDLRTPLDAASVPDDFFTRDLDEMILRGEADVAVHSAKDLPQRAVDGIAVAALLPALDIRDALVFRDGFSPEQPPKVVGTSSPARREWIERLFPGCQTKSIRGTIQQRLDQMDAGHYDAVIIAACALHRLGLAHRIGMHLPYDPAPLQSRLAVTVAAGRADLIKALRTIDVRRRAGMVALVGCPADIRLLADHARLLLKTADIILHDRLLPAEATRLIGDRGVDVGKEGGKASIPQSEIHRRILAEAEQGKLVVRLHGGDPSILAHLGETLAFCAGWNLRAEVLPAVSAAQVASAHARAALTHRFQGRSIRLLTGHDADGEDYEVISGPEHGNLAVYMGVRNRARVTARLRETGWPDNTPVVVGEQLGQDNERIRTATLADLPSLEMETPAVILVGVTACPGEGFTLFTGTDPDLFLRHGPFLHLPMIRLRDTPLDERRKILADQLGSWRGLIVPSRFAVHSLVEALHADGDVRALAGKRLLAVGPATAEALTQHGLRADLVADGFGGIASLSEKILPEHRGVYGYPCSDASPAAQRVEAMARHGVELRPVPFYVNETVRHAAPPRLPYRRVLFTSSSTVKAYFDNFPHERTANRVWLAVGTSTLRTLEAAGLQGELIP